VRGGRLEATDDDWDAVDDTPILDIKPYLTGFAPRGDIVDPQWAQEIMAEYWKTE
jgi:tRNA (Thr-GGU) A37 N-methylase